MRHLKILTLTTLGAVLAFGMVSCLEEEKPTDKGDVGVATAGDTGTSGVDTGTVVGVDTGTVVGVDTGTVDKGDTGATGPNENTNALCSDGVDNDGNKFTDCDDFSCCKNGVPATGITVCTAGTCGGGLKGDTGVANKPDTGVVKPTLPEVDATIKDLRTKTADYTSDLAVFPTTPKSIVTVKDVVVVGSYLHSAGDVDLYVQDVAGGPNSGINVLYIPNPKGTPEAKVGDKVTLKGCLRNNYGVMAIMWCGDDKNTQATVTQNGTATVPAPDAYPATDLGAAATTRDDHLGQPIKVNEVLTLDTATPEECKGTDGKFYCYKLKSGAGAAVYLKTAFTYKCPKVAGPSYPALTGAWDYYQKGDKTLIRSVVPLKCADLE